MENAFELLRPDIYVPKSSAGLSINQKFGEPSKMVPQKYMDPMWPGAPNSAEGMGRYQPHEDELYSLDNNDSRNQVYYDALPRLGSSTSLLDRTSVSQSIHEAMSFDQTESQNFAVSRTASSSIAGQETKICDAASCSEDDFPAYTREDQEFALEGDPIALPPRHHDASAFKRIHKAVSTMFDARDRLHNDIAQPRNDATAMDPLRHSARYPTTVSKARGHLNHNIQASEGGLKGAFSKLRRSIRSKLHVKKQPIFQADRDNFDSLDIRSPEYMYTSLGSPIQSESSSGNSRREEVRPAIRRFDLMDGANDDMIAAIRPDSITIQQSQLNSAQVESLNAFHDESQAKKNFATHPKTKIDTALPTYGYGRGLRTFDQCQIGCIESQTFVNGIMISKSRDVTDRRWRFSRHRGNGEGNKGAGIEACARMNSPEFVSTNRFRDDEDESASVGTSENSEAFPVEDNEHEDETMQSFKTSVEDCENDQSEGDDFEDIFVGVNDIKQSSDCSQSQVKSAAEELKKENSCNQSMDMVAKRRFPPHRFHRDRRQILGPQLQLSNNAQLCFQDLHWDKQDVAILHELNERLSTRANILSKPTPGSGVSLRRFSDSPAGRIETEESISDQPVMNEQGGFIRGNSVSEERKLLENAGRCVWIDGEGHAFEGCQLARNSQTTQTQEGSVFPLCSRAAGLCHETAILQMDFEDEAAVSARDLLNRRAWIQTKKLANRKRTLTFSRKTKHQVLKRSHSDGDQSGYFKPDQCANRKAHQSSQHHLYKRQKLSADSRSRKADATLDPKSHDETFVRKSSSSTKPSMNNISPGRSKDTMIEQ